MGVTFVVGISWNEQEKEQETAYIYVVWQDQEIVANPKLKVS